MVYSLIGVIIVLFIINVIQYYRGRERSMHINDMAARLKRLLEEQSTEKLLLMTDDHAMKQLLVQLNKLLDDKQRVTVQFKKTERSIKKMLANFSHDLKTPLTVVLGYVEMIQSGRMIESEERDRLLQLIHGKTLEIIELMNSFFDLARLEAGDKDIPLSRVHVNELCRNRILSFYEMAEASGLQADIQIPEQPFYALGNEEALERVLNNLISNAIRYGGEGRVLGIKVSGGEKQISIEIWDRGRGITASHQELVFDRMFTLEESRNKGFQGSGLGLAITKRLVEEMGGEITLASIPYERTVFTVKLKRIVY